MSSATDDKYQLDTSIHAVTLCLNHHINKLMHQIHFREFKLHVKLMRHHHRSQHALSRLKINDVYPQTSVDVPKMSLNRNQLNYLSYNCKYELIFDKHIIFLDVITSYLVRVYHTSSTSTIIKQFSQHSANCLYERYMAPLSYVNMIRAQKERKMYSSRYRQK